MKHSPLALGPAVLALFAALALPACRCGGGNTSDSGGGASDATPDAGPPGADASADAAPLDSGAAPSDSGSTVSAACLPGAPIPPTDEMRMILWDGAMRTYDVHVPPGYDRSLTPLVFDFHGFGSNATDQAGYAEMIPKSDLETFIAVHPYGGGDSWNGGVCCGDAETNMTDDVGFVGAMLDALAADLCIDPARVFATGLSNGAFFSYRLACELSDRIAAIAPVAGQVGVDPCVSLRPVPVMAFHGTSDPIVPYDGSVFLGFGSTAESIDVWVTRNGCDPTPVETYNVGMVHCDTWSMCDDGADVILCTIEGGGHTWPGGTVPVGTTTQDIEATDAMWDFFVAHPMP